MALRDFLEKFVTDKLELWQGTEGVDEIAALAFDTLANPSFNPYNPAVANANARLNDVTDRLLAEREKGNISPLVVPRLAAILFEGVFEACVAYWIARGQPEKKKKNGNAKDTQDPKKLKPDVQRFVKLQVRLFTALVGAR